MPAVKAAGAFAGNISNGVPIAGATAPVRQSGKGGDVVVQYRRGHLVYQCDAFVILIGLGIILKL